MWLLVLLVLSILFIIFSTTRLKLHPFLALLMAAFGYGILSGTMTLADVVASVNTGFGGTVGYIGIVILAGSIIGVFLERSGGALHLAEHILKRVGHRSVPLAMSIIGYVVSIPVFCDSGFVILAPLAKALSRKAGVSLAAGVIALSLGLYATHTMVPPTPGPIAAAGILEADLGFVILWAMPVSLIALAAGWLFAVKFAARVSIDNESQPEALDIEGPPVQGPSAVKSIVPIVSPIALIVLKSIADLPSHPLGEGGISQFFRFIGEPVVALLLGAFLAFLLPKKLTRKALIPALLPLVLIGLKLIGDLPSHPFGQGRMTEVIHHLGEPAIALFLGVLVAVLLPGQFARNVLPTTGWVTDGVMAAATIIIITGCGGAFGKVLQNSGIAGVIAEHLDKSTNLSLFLPFAIAAGLKTAQGSSTVAIITTAGIMAPLLETLGLGGATARALTVIAIGAGSMVVSHANDSYFWVVTGFSKMTVKQGYKLQTLGTLVEGGTAAITLWIISLFVL